MKRLVVLLIVVAMAAWGASVFAKPIASLAPLNAFGKQSLASEGKTEADLLNDVPPMEIVKVPAYPGSYFGGSMGTGDVLSSVSLMSKDSPEKVVDWYAKNLGSSWRSFPDQAMGALKEVGVFLETDKKNVTAMDAMKLRQVRVSKVEKPEDTGFAAMMFDVTGIKSMINITVTPLM